ncbi:MAG: archaeosortase/exosortase family protein, partial [Verrucomicrobiota bacterium]
MALKREDLPTLGRPTIATLISSCEWVLEGVHHTCALETDISQGNVIRLTHGEIGVVEACSGLRMLMLFLAITVGASFLV